MKKLFLSLMLILSFFSSSVESIIIKKRIYVKRIDFSDYDCFSLVTKESNDYCDFYYRIELSDRDLFIEWLSYRYNLNYSVNIKIDCIKRCLERFTHSVRGKIIVNFIEYIDVTIRKN